MKYIIHIGICGFGNQLLGFKELCILSKYLDRTIILPIFVPHGTIKNYTKKSYEFKEIFDVEHFKKYFDCIEFKDLSNTEINNNKINNVYNFRSAHEESQANSYLNLNREYYNIDKSIEKSNLNKKFITSITDLNELKSLDDDILVLLGTFNCVKLSTCSKNGCLNKNCNFNSTFKKDYDFITNALTFNNTILTHVDNFLKSKNLNNNDYIAFHLRTSDHAASNSMFKDCYNNLDEQKVYQFIVNHLYETNNINLINKIFVAIPPAGLKIKDMTIFNSNKVILLDEIINDKFILSLIETEICYRSKILFNSPTNTPHETKLHTRSSFTMQIRDLRAINNLNKFDRCITDFTNINYIEVIKEKFVSNKKIISFSLYGNKDIYNYGILLNYELKKIIYKDWIIRLYINNTVNNSLLDYLKTLDIEIFKLNSNIPPMFYRFFPILDNNVDYFISRDLDSIISFREEKMIEEWIDSSKNLHLIHEAYPGHRHIIMGGMFGFKKNIKPNLHKFILNENDEFYYDPWKETCSIKWTPTHLTLIGKNTASKKWTLTLAQDTKTMFLNGYFVEILWHGNDHRQCKIIDNNTILVMHGVKQYYFRKTKSNIVSIDDKNIYNEIINFYINKKRTNFVYCDDQNFMIDYLSEFIPICIDHNQMKQLRWDYSTKFDHKVPRLNTIYKNMNECFVGHRVDTKKLYEEYFNLTKIPPFQDS